jgi:hypothetical protein
MEEYYSEESVENAFADTILKFERGLKRREIEEFLQPKHD